jgi:hypothetical protein
MTNDATGFHRVYANGPRTLFSAGHESAIVTVQNQFPLRIELETADRAENLQENEFLVHERLLAGHFRRAKL